jgi:hypothetical protein
MVSAKLANLALAMANVISLLIVPDKRVEGMSVLVLG